MFIHIRIHIWTYIEPSCYSFPKQWTVLCVIGTVLPFFGSQQNNDIIVKNHGYSSSKGQERKLHFHTRNGTILMKLLLFQFHAPFYHLVCVLIKKCQPFPIIDSYCTVSIRKIHHNLFHIITTIVKGFTF